MSTTQPPSAEVVFDTLFAYQRSAALKTALDLDLFSAIDDGANTAAAAAAAEPPSAASASCVTISPPSSCSRSRMGLTGCRQLPRPS